MELQKMFIDGEWVEGSTGKSVPTLNPSNGEVLAMVTEGNVEDVDKAIAAAKRSFYVTREWRDMDSQTRADILLQIADAIDAEKEDFAKLDCMDHGKPLREAEADVDDAVHCFRYYAGLLKMPQGGVYEVNEGFGKMHSYTVHEPVGVCGLITPWNYPLLMGVWKLAPALAAGNVKKIGLELGGKSPNVIFADADLDGAVEWAMIGIFLNQGEVCSAGSRIIIEESIKDEFVKRLAKKANAITIGDPMENPDMGPLVSESHMNKVLGYIKKGVEEGATLVCGGERYTEGECAKGFYVRPTVFDNCTSDMTIVREEIFGPVVTIQTFKTEQEAIDMANDTEYGLAGAVFTADGSRALRVIKEIRAGITWINCYNPAFNEAPWGGYKKSGIGRDLGVQGLEEYQEIKQININLNPGIVGWYEH